VEGGHTLIQDAPTISYHDKQVRRDLVSLKRIHEDSWIVEKYHGDRLAWLLL
jgi:hypothetical protein